MCYDISYQLSLQTLEDYFGDIVFDDPQLELDFDAGIHVIAQSFSKQRVIIFEDGQYRGKRFEWGVIADYMDSPEKIKKMRSSMCNARAEKITGDKRSYWHRIRHTRCLVPVRGVYEHREIKGWKHKVPYYISLKNRELFCLPGLYHYAPLPDVETGEVRGTYSIITRNANAIMRQIHNGGDNAYRMPLFLPKELELKWLQPDLSDRDLQEILDFEMPADELTYHPVYSIRTTKPRPDGQLKTALFDWPNLPPLGMDDGEMQKALF